MKHAFLVLCHKRIKHLAKLAELNKNIRLYIHVDLKSDINVIKSDFEQSLDNVCFIQKRFDILWAGFSMIEATLELFKVGLTEQDNRFFHLISGEDLLISPINTITEIMNNHPNSIFMDSRNDYSFSYRLRFNMIHANTSIQNKYLGKCITKSYKLYDRFFSQKVNKAVVGSQWFSLNRTQVSYLLDNVSSDDLNFFRMKICPDEHFFQYIFNKEQNIFLGNYRYLIFNKNSPKYLKASDIISAKEKGYWFARKVKI